MIIMDLWVYRRHLCQRRREEGWKTFSERQRCGGRRQTDMVVSLSLSTLNNSLLNLTEQINRCVDELNDQEHQGFKMVSTASSLGDEKKKWWMNNRKVSWILGSSHING